MKIGLIGIKRRVIRRTIARALEKKGRTAVQSTTSTTKGVKRYKGSPAKSCVCYKYESICKHTVLRVIRAGSLAKPCVCDTG